MSTFSPPATPENAAARMRPGSFRSHTVPSPLIDRADITPKSSTSSPSPADKDIENLYACVNAKIVAFSTPSTSRLPSTPARASPADKDIPGTLPWTVPTESTIAAGPLQIYRVISSGIAFLKSGRLLHPTMPSSQCWCVDGESKFVLRIRNDAFYRIELPFDTEEDKKEAEELKGTFAKMLRYEKTPCPFQRGFHVELPETEDSPSRIRVVQSEHPKNKKRWLSGIWMPEGEALRQSSAPIRPERRDSVSTSSTEAATGDAGSTGGPVADADAEQAVDSIHREAAAAAEESTADEPQVHDPIIVPVNISPAPIDILRPREILPVRSITEPVLHRETNPPLEDDSTSVDSSPSSFHTASGDEAPDSSDEAAEEVRPNELYPDGSPLQRRSQHARGVSDVTVTDSAGRPATAGEVSNSSLSPPSTPTLVADDDADEREWHDAITPPNTLRLRRLPKSQPSVTPPGTVGTSSASASQTVFAARAPDPFSLSVRGRGKQLTAALIQKAYLLIMGPSANLIALMLRIAANIANGANILHSYDLGRDTEGLGFPITSGPSRRPANADDADDWDEDDFGIPLGNTVSNASRSSSLSRDHVISRGRQRTPSEIWGIDPAEESPGAAIRRQEVD